MVFKHSKKKRTPLIAKPLRNPGESLEQEINRLLEEELMPYVGMSVMALILASYEWIISVFRLPPQPLAISLVALLLIVFCIYKVFTLRKRIQSLQLGLEGEKVIGQFLEELRSDGCRIFHDIPSGSFNIDHVVVSSHGIFVIETKTISKPLRGEVIIFYDGERILVNGAELSRNPVPQALAERKWIQQLIFETTGVKFAVKVAIVFPGWFIEVPKDKKKGDLWVLNPKLLPGFIEREPTVLKAEDIALVSSRLSDYVRSYKDNS